MKLTHPQHPTPDLWSSLKTLSVTRVLISGILLILLGLSNGKYIWSIDSDVYRFTCSFYLIAALAFALLHMQLKRYFLWQLSAQLICDIGVISFLFFLSGGANSSIVMLYLFPLASCAILAPLSWALFLSSLVTLYIVTVSTIPFFGLGMESAMTNSGVYGAAFLAMVYAVNRVANRLINQEKLALQHQKDLRTQQEINNLVVADMDDGILVIDRLARVYACNPAVKKMLGLVLIPGKTHLSDLPGVHPIADAFFTWLSQLSDVEYSDVGASSIALALPQTHEESVLSNPVMIKGNRRDAITHLKLRFVRVNTALGKEDERYVIFLQDASDVENQAQQLKLASMGRLTASIAHEVRNPLSSISYAAALLGESEAQSNQSARLIKIVSENVVRLNELIEDILRLSRKAQINEEPFSLKLAVQKIVQEFHETRRLRDDVVHVHIPDDIKIRFDQLHLREIVVNLLTNAIRYASGQCASIKLFAMTDPNERLELHIHDDGPGITAGVRAHLFEPFYTTSSQGTGLGLYMARELCLNNGAVLDYEYRVTDMDGGAINTAYPMSATGRFVITFVKQA